MTHRQTDRKKICWEMSMGMGGDRQTDRQTERRSSREMSKGVRVDGGGGGEGVL